MAFSLGKIGSAVKSVAKKATSVAKTVSSKGGSAAKKVVSKGASVAKSVASKTSGTVKKVTSSKLKGASSAAVKAATTKKTSTTSSTKAKTSVATKVKALGASVGSSVKSKVAKVTGTAVKKAQSGDVMGAGVALASDFVGANVEDLKTSTKAVKAQLKGQSVKAASTVKQSSGGGFHMRRKRTIAWYKRQTALLHAKKEYYKARGY